MHSIRYFQALFARLAIVLLFAGCSGAALPPPSDTVANDSAAGPAALLGPVGDARPCNQSGKLQVSLYGAFDGEIHWRADAMTCEGMQRPDGAGARLRFSGIVGDRTLAFIIAIPGLEPGQSGQDLASNLTIIEEGKGRFFSAGNLDNCWTDVSRHSGMEHDSPLYVVDGAVYCIAPLAEVNGPSSLSIRTLEFSGLVDWSAR